MKLQNCNLVAKFRTSQSQDCVQILKCYEWRRQSIKRRFRKPNQTKEHIEKDSNRYFVEKLKTCQLKPKFTLQTFQCVEFSIRHKQVITKKIHDWLVSLICHPWFCINSLSNGKLVKIFPKFTRHQLLTRAYALQSLENFFRIRWTFEP